MCSSIQGVLKIRIVRAVDLRAGDRHVFSQGTSDPYVNVQIVGGKEVQEQRTKTKSETLNPVWHENLKFDIKELKLKSNLILKLDIFDEDVGKEDDFLGFAQVELDAEMLRSVHTNWRKLELEVESDLERCDEECTGALEIGLRWDPQEGGALRSSVRALTRSHHSSHITGVACAGFAGLLLLASFSGRWLCSGQNMVASCHAITVPGAATSVLLAALCAFASFATQLLAAAEGWTASPPEILDPPGLMDGWDNDEAESGLVVKLASESGYWRINVSAQNLFSSAKAPKHGIRLLAWLALAASAVLSCLAVFLTWLELRPSAFFAEAPYLACAACVSILLAAVFFLRAGQIKKENPCNEGVVSTTHRAHTSLTLGSARGAAANKKQQPKPSSAAKATSIITNVKEYTKTHFSTIATSLGSHSNLEHLMDPLLGHSHHDEHSVRSHPTLSLDGSHQDILDPSTPTPAASRANTGILPR